MVEVYSTEFTPERREREVARGRHDLLYFQTAILGLNLFDERTQTSKLTRVHHDLCRFLEGRPPHHPWNRALVCAFRGMGKSVTTTQAYPTWRGIYINGFSTKIISNSDSNARENHFEKIRNLWTRSKQADYLQWLYQDRLPSGLEGWNSNQIVFLSDNPQSAPSITYWGINSKFEGWHGDLVILDDPEGADAEKSLGASQEAWKAYQDCVPLLAEPAQSQILIVATPHGKTPIVYRIRDQQNWSDERDNAHSTVKIFWRELLDESGKSRWPQRFPDSYIRDVLSKDDRFEQQYMLRRRSSSASLFDMDAVVRGFYGLEHAHADERLKVLSYPAFEFNPDQINESGYHTPTPVSTTTRLGALRYYIHFDPVHREERSRKTDMSAQRPSYPAIVVVGVGPDRHAFVVDYWFGKDGKSDFQAQVSQLFRMYCKWGPYLVTWESVGAQFWLKSFVETLERASPVWGNPRSTGALWPSAPLPRLSKRLQEGEKTTQGKEEVFRNCLAPFVNAGVVHFRRDQEEVLRQLQAAQDEKQAVDLLDALAQGPLVWTPPVHEETERGLNARGRFVRALSESLGWKKRTGYQEPPWMEGKYPGRFE